MAGDLAANRRKQSRSGAFSSVGRIDCQIEEFALTRGDFAKGAESDHAVVPQGYDDRVVRVIADRPLGGFRGGLLNVRNSSRVAFSSGAGGDSQQSSG